MKACNEGVLGDGGYDEGYSRSPCFWGRSPGSLVRDFLQRNPSLKGANVLDLGCGEGKNANAFAMAGASVDAVDCSALAIANGRTAFPDANVRWFAASAMDYLRTCSSYDVIVMYGLLHCLPSRQDISALIELAIKRTVLHGANIVVAFNDGPHDLSAHPNFKPTLVSHRFYCDQYRSQKIVSDTDSILRETHPHNNIPHFHSITRLAARVVYELP
jgi:SAM-dependent methyltransferase